MTGSHNQSGWRAWASRDNRAEALARFPAPAVIPVLVNAGLGPACKFPIGEAMNVVSREKAVECFANSIRLDVRCGKRVPVDTACGLTWICHEHDIRAAGSELEAWTGYEWMAVSEITLHALAEVERFEMEHFAPKCGECGQPMHHEGVQSNPVKRTEFDLYTCQTRDCGKYGFTYSFNGRPITENAQ